MNNSRNWVRRRMDLVERRRSAPTRRNHFNHGDSPIGAIYDDVVAYWPESETGYLYYNSDTPWLQRDESVTHSCDFWEHLIDPLDPVRRLVYGHLVGLTSYNAYDWRQIPPPHVVGTVRPRPKDFV